MTEFERRNQVPDLLLKNDSGTRWGQGRKTVAGDLVSGARSVYQAMEANTWLYLRDKPIHPRVLNNMPFSCVMRYLSLGHIRWAMRAEDPTKYYKTR